MTPEDVFNKLRQVPDEVLIAMSMDLRACGTGILRIDSDGNVRHVPIMEAYEEPASAHSAAE